MIGSRQPGAISSRSGRAQRVPDVCPRMRAAAWTMEPATGGAAAGPAAAAAAAAQQQQQQQQQ